MFSDFLVASYSRATVFFTVNVFLLSPTVYSSLHDMITTLSSFSMDLHGIVHNRMHNNKHIFSIATVFWFRANISLFYANAIKLI